MDVDGRATQEQLPRILFYIVVVGIRTHDRVTLLSTAKLPRPAHSPYLHPCRQQKTNEKKAAPITAPRKKHGVPAISILNKAAAELANNAQTSSRKTPYSEQK